MEDDTVSDIKPCPFCGSKVAGAINSGQDCHFVFCGGCGADGPLAETESQAWEAWNRRTPPTTQTGAEP